MNELLENSLSPQGEKRRAEILRLMTREGRWMRRRRMAGRLAAGCAIVALAVILFPRHQTEQIAHQPHPAKTDSVPRLSPPLVQQRPRIIITRIQTDPTLTTRLAVPPQKPTWQRIGDDALLARLAEAGKPAGLAYVDGHAMILFRNKLQR